MAAAAAAAAAAATASAGEGVPRAPPSSAPASPPPPHERQDFSGVAAEDEPVRGTRAPGHALRPGGGPVAGAAEARASRGAAGAGWIPAQQRHAPGRRAQHVREAFGRQEERERSCGWG